VDFQSVQKAAVEPSDQVGTGLKVFYSRLAVSFNSDGVRVPTLEPHFTLKGLLR
jgi:hypothetical protein